MASRTKGPGKTRPASLFEESHSPRKLQIVPSRRGGGELRIRREIGLTRAEFARLVAISERTLADIEKGRSASDAAARAIAQIQRLTTALSEVIRSDAIGTWLATPNQAFGGLKPLELIERGEIDRIWEMVYYVRSGNPF